MDNKPTEVDPQVTRTTERDGAPASPPEGDVLDPYARLRDDRGADVPPQAFLV